MCVLGRAWRCPLASPSRIAERFPPGNLSTLPITVRTIKANNSPAPSPPGRGEGSHRGRSGTGRMKGQSVCAPHFRVCPFSLVEPNVDYGDGEPDAALTCVGNNNGHWPSWPWIFHPVSRWFNPTMAYSFGQCSGQMHCCWREGVVAK